VGIRVLIKAFTDPDAEYLLKDTIKTQFKSYDQFQNMYKKDGTDHHGILTNMWASSQHNRNVVYFNHPPIIDENSQLYLQNLGFITVALLSIMNQEDACTMMGCQFYLLNIKDEDKILQQKSKNTIRKAEIMIEELGKKYEILFPNAADIIKEYKSKNPQSEELIEMLYPGMSIMDIMEHAPNLIKIIKSNYTGIDINEL
jgi:hypothetical protein